MKVGIIDADLIGRKRHRFPNLACLKISGYHKDRGDEVFLLTRYDGLDSFDKVYLSKVFTDTPVPEWVLNLSNVEFGGTGFFFDEAPNLPGEIEHHFPDYHLYDDFIEARLAEGAKKSEFKEYLNYSIGFLTRGCFRKCPFCVNQKYDRVFEHSPLSEFYDPERPNICLLDDNFFGCPNWKTLLQELMDTGKKFKFKQGLDERLLTDEKVQLLCKARYDGDPTFAFDNIADYPLIEEKLKMLRKYTDRQFNFYVLVAFEGQDAADIESAFKRIELLMRYKCLPYIMRFERYRDSPYSGMYITLARWCNQPSFFKKKSFREFCFSTNGQSASAGRYASQFETEHPDIAARYFDMKWEGGDAE